MDRTNSKILTLLSVALLASSFFFVGLNRVPVPPVDASIRANEARTILNTGQWFPIMERGVPVVDHPPLYVWVQAFSMKVFGVNDFAANFPERFFAFGFIIVFFLLSHKLFALKNRELNANQLTNLALLSVLVLLTTRDHVLSSVRGYIESMMIFFIYASLYFVVTGYNKTRLFLAGVFMFLAFFTKGPPVLWPFIFSIGILLLPIVHLRKRLIGCASFFAGFAMMVTVFICWNEKNGTWIYWKRYLFEQVLSSALEGRGGRQAFEPFYFVNILWTYYWPWLPFLLISVFVVIKKIFEKENHIPLAVAVLGWGFIAGFSLVKWKFWYYIAPAYPAFALLIVMTFESYLTSYLAAKLKGDFLCKFIASASIVWIIATNVLPIPLHLERAPQVHAFKSFIKESKVTGPVWFIHSLCDHNIIGTNGEWYFDRHVLKVTDGEEKDWYLNKLQKPAWIFTDANHFRFCMTTREGGKMSPWCQNARIIAKELNSVLLYYQ